MKNLVLLVMVMVGSLVWAETMKPEMVAKLVAAKATEAVNETKDFSSIFNHDGFAPDRSQEFKDFLKQKNFREDSLNGAIFESSGSVLKTTLSGEVYKIDFANLAQGKVTVNGYTVKASSDFETVYRSITISFGQIHKSWLKELFIQDAEAAETDVIKSLRSIITGLVANGTSATWPEYTFLTDRRAKNKLLRLMKGPDPQFFTDIKCSGESFSFTLNTFKNGKYEKQVYDYDGKFEKRETVLTLNTPTCQKKFTNSVQNPDWRAAFEGYDKIKTTDAEVKACNEELARYTDLNHCCKKDGCMQSLQDDYAAKRKKVQSTVPSSAQ